MKALKTASENAAGQMTEALARWERDGGAHAKTMTGRPVDGPVPLGIESVLADVAKRQGMLLERSGDNGAADYRLVPQDHALLPGTESTSFKLTLDDVETILMNGSPA
jgi:hypothetical protein